jgi:hypothetical protein
MRVIEMRPVCNTDGGVCLVAGDHVARSLNKRKSALEFIRFYYQRDKGNIYILIVASFCYSRGNPNAQTFGTFVIVATLRYVTGKSQTVLWHSEYGEWEVDRRD